MIDSIQNVIEINNQDFNFVKETIYKECGIKLSETKRALVQARLMRRVRELKLSDYNEYCCFVKDNYKEEVVNLINCITTNKTEFFRESYHFDFLNNAVLPMYQNEKKNKIRVWSAGCSTGEEAYTIAITLLEFFGIDTSLDIKILATDIDTKVLETAQNGIYGEGCFQNMNHEVLRKYFLRGKDNNHGLFRAKDDVKNIIHFRRLNLLNESFPMKGPFDIIFCRNVIIYFDKESQKKLIEKFHKFVDADGYLFMGHSEALSGLSEGFYSVGRSIYRRE